ncbi:hypothetical protein [Nonomuraea sp. NBC_01738]|uniref:hypothetical protein n=1 Tax=Nonomuraea sp. NBC_01738 TaxID=2976003 RepID=UPI003FA3D0D0
MPLIRAIQPVRGRVGRPRKRPVCLYADRGYDHDKYRRLVWRTGIKPMIARRGTPHDSGLGIHRWVVERTIALLQCEKLLVVDPNLPSPEQFHQQQVEMARCLRGKGIEIADPKPGAGLTMPEGGDEVLKAMRACQAEGKQ